MVQRAQNGGGGTDVRNAGKLLAAFSSYLVDELGRSPRTAESYCCAIRMAEKRLHKPAHKIKADDLRGLLRTGHYAQSSKRSIIVAFHQFHDWGATDGRWKRDGIATLKTPKVISDPKAPVSSSTARLLLTHARSPNQVRAVYLPLLGGLRIREATLVREEHWHDNFLVLPPDVTKGAKKRKVPIHPELEEAKDVILSTEPENVTSLQVMFGRLRDRLEITDLEGKDVTPHTLRRTCSNTLYERGVRWEVVQTILGHEVGVTEKYVRIPDDVMLEAINRLEYFAGPVQLCLW